jgi:hypothetical protein
MGRRRTCRRSAGFTLLELLIAGSISLAALAALAFWSRTVGKQYLALMGEFAREDTKAEMMAWFDCFGSMTTSFPSGADCSPGGQTMTIVTSSGKVLATPTGKAFAGETYRGYCRLNREKNELWLQRKTGGTWTSVTAEPLYCPRRFRVTSNANYPNQNLNPAIWSVMDGLRDCPGTRDCFIGDQAPVDLSFTYQPETIALGCMLMGMRADGVSTSYTLSGCGDNHNIRWVPATKTFGAPVSSCMEGGKKVDGLSCRQY